MPSVEESPDLEHRRRPHAIPAFVGPLVRSRHTKPCPTYFEVSFLDSKSQVLLPFAWKSSYFATRMTLVCPDCVAQSITWYF